MLIDLSGRAAIVTGGGKRIGKATAKRLAESGASVVIAEIDEHHGKAVADEICSDGGTAIFAKTDVSIESDIRQMTDACLKNFGRLDMLINNAHASISGNAEELDPEDWDYSFSVLLKAHYLGAKYAVGPMRLGGGGSIINLSSVLGKHPVRRRMAYTTAKAAVVQLSRQMALDFGPDRIRVNTVTPGDIKPTEHRQPRDPDFVPAGGTGVPQDIANAICFLVSDQASFITGSELIIDGGQMLPYHGQVAADTHRKETPEEYLGRRGRGHGTARS